MAQPRINHPMKELTGGAIIGQSPSKERSKLLVDISGWVKEMLSDYTTLKAWALSYKFPELLFPINLL